MAAHRLEALQASQPDQARLTLSLAMIEERRGAWQRALDLVEPLIKKKPNSVEVLNFWGFVAADHSHDWIGRVGGCKPRRLWSLARARCSTAWAG